MRGNISSPSSILRARAKKKQKTAKTAKRAKAKAERVTRAAGVRAATKTQLCRRREIGNYSIKIKGTRFFDSDSFCRLSLVLLVC